MIKSQKKTSFPLETLSTHDFRWIQSHLWENDQISWFAKYFREDEVFSRSRSVYRKHQEKEGGYKLAGRWLLLARIQGAEAIIGWAEARSKGDRLSGLSLSICLHEVPECPELTPIYYLLSACFVALDIDYSQLDLIGPILSKAAVTFPVEWQSEVHVLEPEWLLLAGKTKNAFTAKTIIQVTKSAWEATEIFAESRASMTYLEKRLTESPLFEPRRRPRGLFAMLSSNKKRRDKPRR